MKVSEAIEHLKRYKPEDEVCMVLWMEDDVRSHNGESTWMDEEPVDPPAPGEELTDEEVRKVLQLMDKWHDCEFGICWETVDSAVRSVKKERVTT
jgi:ASC-1-like (ASCH) protein